MNYELMLSEVPPYDAEQIKCICDMLETALVERNSEVEAKEVQERFQRLFPVPLDSVAFRENCNDDEDLACAVMLKGLRELSQAWLQQNTTYKLSK